jgi:hypothetical protein
MKKLGNSPVPTMKEFQKMYDLDPRAQEVS